MNFSDAPVPSELAEQQSTVGAVAAPSGSNSGGAPTSSCTSGSSPSWPPAPPPLTSNGSSFFRQLFADDDDSAVAVDADDTAAVSSYVNDLLLLPSSASAAAAAFDNSADQVFHMGAFPMDSFLNRVGGSTPEALDLGEQTTVSGRPHTLEFVNPPFSTSYSRTSADHQVLIEPHNQFSKRSPSVPQIDDDEHQANYHAPVAAKKAKVQLLPADQQCTSGSVDPSHLQSIINKVSQSQSARSKEKLGERINALQQLVSPFGKTDTASVLSEAIGYIKFLQEQVQVLSSPYMKPCNTLTSTSFQDGGLESAASDLRSRGLCLVPVSCTMTVANNNNFNIGADYWASTPNLSCTTGNGANTTRFSASS